MKLTVNLPNLSITRGQIPADSPRPTRSRNWGRLLARGFGWGLAGTFFFLFFAWLSLPTEAIAWRISHEAKKAGFAVEVEDVSVMPWGTVSLENVTWTFEPTSPDTPPQQYFLEEVDASIGLFSLLTGDLDIEVETEREDGTVWARYVKASSESTVEINIDGLPLYDVPKAAQSFNVPLYGLLNIKADLTLPQHKFSKAEGTITVACSACRAGDGDSKLTIPGGSKSLQEGISKFPEIDLGTLTGKLKVAKGAATIEDTISTESEDLIMSLEGRLKLKDPFKGSRFKMVMKVELTQAFLKRAERVALIYRGAGATSKLAPPERGLGFKLEGPVAKPRFRGVNSKSSSETLAERRKKRRARDARRAGRRKGKKKKKPKAKDEDAKDDKDDKATEDAKRDADAKDDKRDTDEKDDKRDEDRGEDDDEPQLNIRPTSDDPENRPALPPSDEDDVEIFDPAENGDDGGAEGDPSAADGGNDSAQGNGGEGDGGQGDGGEGDGGQGDGGQGDGGQDDGGQGDGGNGGGTGNAGGR